MTIRNIFILAVIFVSLTCCNGAYASGNVLLPNDNADKANLPNLGLSPAESAPEPTPVEDAKKTEPVKTETPVAESKLPPPEMVKPQPIASPRPYPIPYPQPHVAPPVRYTINVSMGKTTFTPNDLDTINTQLGLDKGSIASSCRMGINGMLITDRGTSTVESNATTSTDISYEGALTNALLSVYASCDAAPKPAPYNYIQRMGDKFAVSLGSAFCEPKTPFSGTMHQIIISHASTGNDSCLYKQ